MVHLDTNLLIALADPGSIHRSQVERVVKSGSHLGTSAIAWFEFRNGPLSEAGLRVVGQMLRNRWHGFGTNEAEEAARLFNAVGRSRRIRFDAMIAACAVVAGAELATANPDDFTPFVVHGLKLWRP